MDWNRVVVSIWWGLIGSLLLLEAYFYLDRNPHTPLLTNVVIQETPPWLKIPAILFFLWLAIHFDSRFLGRPIL